MKQQLLDGIAQILEVNSVTEETVLSEVGNWDSLAVVCTIALLDEKAAVEVDGVALAGCATVGDVLRLAGVREQQAIVAGDVGDLDSVLRAPPPGKLCILIFKNHSCRYSGDAVTCDKSLRRCTELGNQVNYHGSELQ